MAVRIVVGDCREKLRELASESVHCVVSSPPYFGLRDYGVAGQIGLEPTPEAYVAEMVAVFREVRRVLRGDGTLWLNLGDSYAGPWGAQSRGQQEGVVGTLSAHQIAAHPKGQTGTGSLKNTPGLKAKDLIGIPWRVAFALQQPYYTGRILQERDRVWLAAMVDGEGCFYIHKRKAGADSGARFTKADGTESVYLRNSDSYAPAFEVANTCEAIVRRCAEISGCGSVTRQDKDRRQPLYRWTVRCDDAKGIAREIYPYLVAKQQQCRIICGAPANGPKAEAGWLGLKALHSGSTTEADFPEPPSMLEPGWYLRSEIVWSKPNPMPESVTDRPTSAHEKIFLFAKSARYFYDAAAVREAGRGGGRFNGSVDYAAGDRNDAGRRDVAVAEDRNLRNVWTVPSQPFADAHFATFPPALIEPCIKAGCPVGGTVLDPFGGAGTTGLVADRLGRDAILVELNPTYAEMARRRIAGDAGMFADVSAA